MKTTTTLFINTLKTSILCKKQHMNNYSIETALNMFNNHLKDFDSVKKILATYGNDKIKVNKNYATIEDTSKLYFKDIKNIYFQKIKSINLFLIIFNNNNITLYVLR